MNKPTKDQEKIILANNNVLVAASAGTGKSTTMIQKIIHLIINEGVELPEILVLVFTDANSRELKKKIYDALYDELLRSKEHEKVLIKAISDIPYANIHTVHSFSSKVAKEHFNELQISPTYAIISSDQDEKLIKIINAVLDMYAMAENPDDTYVELMQIFDTRANAVDQIMRLYTKMTEQEDFEKSLSEIENKTNEQFLKEYIQTITRYYQVRINKLKIVYKKLSDDDMVTEEEKIKAQLRELDATSCDELKKDWGTLLNEMESIRSFINYCDSINCIEDLLKISEFKFARRPNGYLDKWQKFESSKKVLSLNEAIKKEIVDPIKPLFKYIESIKKDTDPYQTVMLKEIADFNKYIKLIMQILRQINNEYTTYKISHRIMTYNDLQIYCLKALTIDEEYKNRFKNIFVDEYQDLNPIQEAIVNKLSRDNLLAVGDIKQSIYTFRDADPTIFLNRARRYLESGDEKNHILYLKDNFRSSPAILDFVNKIFKNEMTEELSDVNYENEAFTVDTDNIDHEDINYIFINSKAENEEDEIQKTRKYIVAQINNLIEQGYKYNDIVFLTRKNIHKDPLNKKYNILGLLDQNHIPYRTNVADSAKSLVVELISFLNVLNNPHKDSYMLGFLTSFFSNLNEKDLNIINNAVLLRQKELAEQKYLLNSIYDKLVFFSEHFSISNDSSICTKEHYRSTIEGYKKKVLKILGVIKKFKIYSGVYPLNELINKIISEFHYDEYLKSLNQNAYSALLSLISESANYDSISEFVRELENIEINIKGGGSDVDAIDFSTIHSYKGLEKPVVFASMVDSRGMDVMSSDINLLGKDFYSFKTTDIISKSKKDNISNFAFKCLKSERELKDELRLLYVQLTRVKNTNIKNKLIILQEMSDEYFGEEDVRAIDANINLAKISFSGKYHFNKSSFKSIMEDAIISGDLGVNFYKIEEINNGNEVTDKKQYEEVVIPKDIEKQIEKLKKFEYKNQDALTASIHYSVLNVAGANTNLERKEIQEPGVEVLDRIEKKMLMSLGVIYHKVLEKIDYTIKEQSAVSESINNMVSAKIITQDEREKISDEIIDWVLNSKVIRDNVYKGGILKHEVEVSAAMKVSELFENNNCEDMTLLEGIIDLLIIGKENVIIDFKLSKPKDDAIKEQYFKQVSMYKTIYEKGNNIKIDKKILVYLLNKEYEIVP